MMFQCTRCKREIMTRNRGQNVAKCARCCRELRDQGIDPRSVKTQDRLSYPLSRR